MKPSEHREKALELLERAERYSPGLPVALGLAALAQVHATLALVEAQTQPQRSASRERRTSQQKKESTAP